MRAKNILHLGVKELWSLARDPIMLLLIVFAFTVSIYSTASGAAGHAPQGADRHRGRGPVAACRSGSSTPSSRRCSCRRRWCRGRRWTPGWTPGWTPSPSTSPPTSSRTCWPGARPRSSSTPTRPAWARRSPAAATCRRSSTARCRRCCSATGRSSEPPVDVEDRVRFNPNLTRSWFGAVVALIDMITMLSVLLTGAALIRERERGTVEHLLVMPVTPFEIMTSKVWSMGLVVLVASAVSMIVRRAGLAGGPDPGFGRAVPVRRGAAPVRRHVAGHVPGHLRPHDAAVRPADDPGAAALADALRRHDPAGEHARVGAADHAGGAHHPLRHAGPGHPVPRRRAWRSSGRSSSPSP